MYFISLLFIISIAALIIYVIYAKVKHIEIKIFLITYIIATLIRGISGVSFNVFFDKFNLILFLKDLMIWTVSYIAVRMFIIKYDK